MIVHKDIAINGLNIHYLEAGTRENRAIILLQGGFGDAEFHWSRLIPDLSENYYLIAPDLPGFGGTTPLPQMTYAALIEWLDTLFDSLSIEKAVLVGHSIGGLLARLFASVNEERVPTLFLINGGSLPPKPAPAAKFLVNTPIIGDLIINNLSRQGIANRKAMDWVFENHEDQTILTDEMITTVRNSAPGLAQIMRMQMMSAIPNERIPNIPTFMLWGENDTIAPISSARKVKRAIPNTELTPIAETKHAPHIEEPDIVSFHIHHTIERLNRPDTPSLPGAGMLG